MGGWRRDARSAHLTRELISLPRDHLFVGCTPLALRTLVVVNRHGFLAIAPLDQCPSRGVSGAALRWPRPFLVPPGACAARAPAPRATRAAHARGRLRTSGWTRRGDGDALADASRRASEDPFSSSNPSGRASRRVDDARTGYGTSGVGPGARRFQCAEHAVRRAPPLEAGFGGPFSDDGTWLDPDEDSRSCARRPRRTATRSARRAMLRRPRGGGEGEESAGGGLIELRLEMKPGSNSAVDGGAGGASELVKGPHRPAWPRRHSRRSRAPRRRMRLRRPDDAINTSKPSFFVPFYEMVAHLVAALGHAKASSSELSSLLLFFFFWPRCLLLVFFRRPAVTALRLRVYGAPGRDGALLPSRVLLPIRFCSRSRMDDNVTAKLFEELALPRGEFAGTCVEIKSRGGAKRLHDGVAIPRHRRDIVPVAGTRVDFHTGRRTCVFLVSAPARAVKADLDNNRRTPLTLRSFFRRRSFATLVGRATGRRRERLPGWASESLKRSAKVSSRRRWQPTAASRAGLRGKTRRVHPRPSARGRGRGRHGRLGGRDARDARDSGGSAGARSPGGSGSLSRATRRRSRRASSASSSPCDRSTTRRG